MDSIKEKDSAQIENLRGSNVSSHRATLSLIPWASEGL